MGNWMKTKWPLFFIVATILAVVAGYFIILRPQDTVPTPMIPQENQENGITSIRPGGGPYTVVVQVHKPSYIALPETVGSIGWEIRAYFYTGTNCYNTGDWWNPSGDTWLYTGWWEHRTMPGTWAGIPEDETLMINTYVIDKPRPTADIEHGMSEIPSPGSISLRTRLLIKNIKHKVDGQYVTFTVGGIEYRYLYTADSYGDLWIGDPEFARVDVVEDRLAIDQNMLIDVIDDAPATGTIYMSLPIDISLPPASPEPLSKPIEIPLFVSVAVITLVVVAIVVAIAYIAVSRRAPEEELEL